MPIIRLRLKEKVVKSHNIYVEDGITKRIPEILEKTEVGKKYAIITDTIVEKLFAKKLQNALKRKKIKSEIISFKKGEQSKTMTTAEKLGEEMINKGFDRQDAVIALGGGVVGDLGGFVASIYMRGIPYIHVPTTLMAMVDSAIGGKTGVDLKNGKNLMGTIIQPKVVFVDMAFLKNLPLKQIQNGLAEVIKYGVIKDKRLFKFLEQNMEKILKKDPAALKYILKRSIKVKVDIVRKDEREKTGLRATLNYGHTYGHALEKLSGYKLLHGHAISIGMVIINKLAVAKGTLKEKHANRIKKLLISAGLPVTTMKKITKKDLLSDKKKEGDYVNLILATKIGSATIVKAKCK
ncbi:MAG: 3-dehydroquinate synthase [Nitrospirota bacterium]